MEDFFVNPAALREATNKAIREAKEEKARQEALQREKEKLALEESESKGRGIVASIPGRARVEALAGKDELVVMQLEYSDYNKPYDNKNWDKLLPEQLKGVAKYVYDWCVKAKLNPVLQHNHDGVGYKDWFELIIRW